MDDGRFMCPVLILAAGQSRRMRGRDKMLEDVDGEPLLRSRARVALATGQQVVVVLPDAAEDRRAALDRLPVTVVVAERAADGMAASIVAGLAAVPEEACAVMILLADLPEITEDDLNAVLSAASADRTAIWRGASEDGRAGHPVVFPKRFFADLAGLRGDSGAQSVISVNRDALRLCPLPQARAVTDLDTPEAWAAWRAGRKMPQ